MAEPEDLSVTLREGTGKGAARTARRAGLVPGVVYGGGKDPQAINIPHNVLLKRLQQGQFLSTLFNLKVEGQDDVRVICRGVQRDVVKDLPTHVDFLRLTRKSRINLNIPVEFLNQETSVGLKRGGTLVVVRSEIEMKVTAGNIPDKIEIDLAEIDINDTIKISDVALPEGTRPMITDRDFMIANISAPSGLKSADAEDEEGEGEEDAVEGGEES